MKKSLFAATVAASLLTLAPAQAQFIAPYGTGFNGASGYQYSTPQAATMSVMLQGMQQQSMMSSMMSTSYYARYAGRRGRSRPTAAQLQEARGKKLIKRGHATMSFTMRPAPSVAWVDSWAKTNPQGRAGALAEWRAQSTIWRQEVAARGAKYGDMADMMAVALVSCVEGYSGKRVNNAGFRVVVNSFKKVWLRDANYQGYTRVQKQQNYEDAMLSGSWALYLRRKGDPESLKKARESANKFLETYWSTDLKNTSDADGAVIFLARYSGKAAPKKSPALIVRAAKPQATTQRNPRPIAVEPEPGSAPQDQQNPGPRLTLAQAAQITNFKPVAPMVLPDAFLKMAPEATPEQREMIENVCGKLLKMVREEFAANKKATLPVNNVARSMTYALTQLYPVATVKIGQPVAPGPLTAPRVAAMRTQFALILASNAQFKQMSDREKQELAEMMIVVPTMAGILYNVALKEGDQEGMRDAQQIARETFGRFFGSHASKVSFSDEQLEVG